MRAVVLARQIVRRIEAKAADQLGEKFGFERAHSDELAVRAAIGSVERQAAIEKVLTARALPETPAAKAEDHRKLGDGTVEDGGVDDLAQPGVRQDKLAKNRRCKSFTG